MCDKNSSVVAEYIPLNLSPEQMEDPKEALRSFFTTWSLDEMRNVLWDVFSRSLTVDDDEMGPFSRKALLFYYEEIVQVLEAACLLHRVPGRIV